jgi:hypothetical protein
MIVLHRSIAGMIRYRRIFFPTDEQLLGLVKNLGPLDLLRVFSTRAICSNEVRPISRNEGQTTLVDLSEGQDAIYASIHTNCRYKIRRAHKLRDRIEILMNSAKARADFLPLYNRFARAKGKLRVLTPQRLNEYTPYSDVFMLYFDGVPTCGRLVLRDVESRIALMMYSGTTRLDYGADTITVGLLNRYLHWHEMKTYQAAGMKKYDFGGAGSANPPATQFKRSFGGELSSYHYGLYAGTARIAREVAHLLYTRWTEASSILKIPF